jgi:hypothetical protein
LVLKQKQRFNVYLHAAALMRRRTLLTEIFRTI